MTTIAPQPGVQFPPLFSGNRPPAFTGDQIVAKFDTDADGGISFAEVETSRAAGTVDEALFAKIDGDTDGLVTASEWETFRQSDDFRSDMGIPARSERAPGLADARSLIQSLFQSDAMTAALEASVSDQAEAGYSDAQAALNPAI